MDWFALTGGVLQPPYKALYHKLVLLGWLGARLIKKNVKYEFFALSGGVSRLPDRGCTVQVFLLLGRRAGPP